MVFTLEKLYRKSLRCKYRFVIYHLEERSASTAIRHEKCAEIFVSSVNKNPVQHTIRDAVNSYMVFEHGLKIAYWINDLYNYYF